ncbi:MAG: signal peptidase I [Bacteroidales bacterium]|jgi:signal peptidase I|nr:signal peptidase I [Bacteroidales bacterium]
MKSLWFWGKALIIALAIGWLLRTFVFSAYRIPASSMENTLMEGDYILVGKYSYGIRLPVTVLGIPFCHDSILGMKAYSSVLSLPYKRIFKQAVHKDDIIVFNNPGSDIRIPIDMRKILIGRCLALPGDSLVFKNDLVYVNEKELIQSPNLLEPYYFHEKDVAWVEKTLSSLVIPEKQTIAVVDSLHVKLFSRQEIYMMKGLLPDTVALHLLRPAFNLTIPKKGERIAITSDNYFVYLPIITGIEKKDAHYENGKLWIDGVEMDAFEFTQDYYWIMPDNRKNFADSSVSSFIPENHLIGKALFAWNYGFQKIK